MSDSDIASTWRTLVKHGRFPKGFAGERSGSALTWWICIGARREGLELDEVRELLADPANRGGRTYRERLPRRGTKNGDHWLTTYVWPSACKAADSRPVVPVDASAARASIQAVAEAVELSEWRGVAGATDRAVLAAILARALARGSLTPTMSHREIAEATPCHRRTVPAAVRRLKAAGWLLEVKRGGGETLVGEDGLIEVGRATQWRLRLPASWQPARPCPIGGTPVASSSLSGASARGDRRALDACRWRGLGLNAPRILDALASGPRTATELSAALGLSAGHLRSRLLPRLQSFELVERRVDGSWQAAADLPEALAAAAETLELAGKADEVAASHRLEREQYLQMREETRPLRQLARRKAFAAELAARRPVVPDAPQALPADPDRHMYASENGRANRARMPRPKALSEAPAGAAR